MKQKFNQSIGKKCTLFLESHKSFPLRSHKNRALENFSATTSKVHIGIHKEGGDEHSQKVEWHDLFIEVDRQGLPGRPY